MRGTVRNISVAVGDRSARRDPPQPTLWWHKQPDTARRWRHYDHVSRTSCAFSSPEYRFVSVTCRRKKCTTWHRPRRGCRSSSPRPLPPSTRPCPWTSGPTRGGISGTRPPEGFYTPEPPAPRSTTPLMGKSDKPTITTLTAFSTGLLLWLSSTLHHAVLNSPSPFVVSCCKCATFYKNYSKRCSTISTILSAASPGFLEKWECAFICRVAGCLIFHRWMEI